MTDAWKRWFWTPTTGVDLGVCRIVLYAGLVPILFDRTYHAFAYWPTVADRIWVPAKVFGLVAPPRLGPGLSSALLVLFAASLVASAAGLCTRLATALAFVLGVYWIALSDSFGFVYHNDAFLLWVLGIMAFSRSGDRVSLDALRRPVPEVESGEYRWPIALVCLLLSLLYFGAGLNKLRHGGLAWITSDHLAKQLAYHFMTHSAPTGWGPRLATTPLAPNLLALGTVVVECSALLAVFSRRLRPAIVAGLFLMQLGIYLLLGLRFFSLLLSFAFWVPWSRLDLHGLLGRTANPAAAKSAA